MDIPYRLLWKRKLLYLTVVALVGCSSVVNRWVGTAYTTMPLKNGVAAKNRIFGVAYDGGANDTIQIPHRDDVAETTEGETGLRPAEESNERRLQKAGEKDAETPNLHKKSPKEKQTANWDEVTETTEGATHLPAVVSDKRELQNEENYDAKAPHGDTEQAALHNRHKFGAPSSSADHFLPDPKLSPTEKWEKLWRSSIGERIEVHSNATSENVSQADIELEVPLANRLRLFDHTLSPSTAREKGALSKLFDAFPLPKHEESVAMYNEDAYNRLISKLLLVAQSGDRKFKIVASGGSITAGAGKPTLPIGERYFARFADYLKNILSTNRTGIEYIDQGHGSRTSLHTAVLHDNFIPSDTDLLIWEFAINDASDFRYMNDTVKTLRIIKQSLLAWLHQVNSMEQPPFVILLYYWDTPFQTRNRNRTHFSVLGSSFDSHGDIARQFDFVLGHANLGGYIEELQLDLCWGRRGCPMLSDKHHASKLGHIASAFLLLNLLSPDDTFRSSAHNRTFSANGTKYEWICGTETEEKKVLKSVITNSSNGWRSTLGTWTLDLPVHNESLLTTKLLVPAQPLDRIELMFPGVGHRQDRARSTSLHFCSANDTFSLRVQSQPMKNVRLILLNLKGNYPLLKTGAIIVQINGSNATTRGELVPINVQKAPDVRLNWPCHFGAPLSWGVGIDKYWYIFESTEPVVHSVNICTVPGLWRKPPSIQSLAFW